MHRPTLFAVIAALSLSISLPAMADTDPGSSATVDEIVVTGSFVPTPADTSASAITTINADDLVLAGPVLLPDLLRDVPGLSVSRSGPSGQLTQVRLRGTEANHVLVMVNGFPVNDPFTGGYDFAFSGSSLLSGVEVLRGEQSALWGSGALGGVIDMQSRPSGSSLSGFVEAGSLNTQTAQMQFSRSDERHALWGGISASRSGGMDVSGLGSETDGYERQQGLLGARMMVNDRTQVDFLLMANHGRSDYDSDTDYDGRLNETSDRLDRDVLRAQAHLHHDGSAGVGYDFGAQFVRNVDDNSGTFSRGSSHFGYMQANKEWQSHRLDQSLTIRGEVRQLDFRVDAGPGALQNQDRSETRGALAGEYRVQTKNLVVQLTAREETGDLFANAHALQAGLVWKTPLPGGRLRLRFGEGIKNPGFYELFGYFPSTFVGNPQLKAEQQQGFEVGWEQDAGPVQFSVSAFSSRLHDEIYTDFSQFPYTARNRDGASTRKGVELAGSWQVSATLQVKGSLSHILADNEAGIAELRRPKWLGSLGAQWQQGKWQISAAMDSQSSQLDTDFSTFTTVALPGFALLRARIAREVLPGIWFYARGENLLDRKAQEVVGYAAQGRTIMGGIRVAM